MSGLSAAGPEAPVEQGSKNSTYRAHLDGLRALAVYLVVLFHAGADRFSGGFIGVDVFFVLSGYLVTQVLMRDLGGSGSIRYGRFYARRFRRLLPAAFVVLVITAAAFTAVASPADALAALDAFKAAFLYSANWFFIHRSDAYFGETVATNPVMHFWSLAVEEQFYLLWPLVLGSLFWLAGRFFQGRSSAVRVAVGAGVLASAIWALTLRSDSPNRAYYGTDARAYQLLAGASIALAPGLIRTLSRFPRVMRPLAPTGVATLLMLASSWVHLDAVVRGVAVTVTACALIVAVESVDSGLVQGMLSRPPIVYLGKISYGTYLWHWPVILIAARLFELSSVATVGITALVATGLASLSYQLLERPLRESRRLDGHRVLVIGSGLVLSAISALVVIPAIVGPGPGSVAASTAPTTGLTPIPAGVDWLETYYEFFGNTKGCVGAPPQDCTVVRGGGQHILLMGDSNAQMMIPLFIRMAQQERLTLSLAVQAGCPWQLGSYVLTTEVQEKCRRTKEDAYERVIPALDPDVIVLINAGRQGSDPEFEEGVYEQTKRTTRASLAELRGGGRRVVIIEPMPQAPRGVNPLTCLSKAKVLEECRYVAETEPSRIDMLYRELDEQHDDVWSADLDRLVCPFLPICDPVIDGLIVKWDGQHLAARYARSLSEEVAASLRDIGALPRR
ncbi:MAG: acyltransferase family protein [Acidimicrobiales bacterium]